MRMQSEEGTEAGKSCENGEAVSVGTPAAIEGSISQKYRDLKSKLKYLIYEHRCFESELSKAQNRLVQLSRDKTVLLDQLLQYEPMSGDEDEVTDYSGSEGEEVDKHTFKQPGTLSVRPSSIRSSRSPVATTSLHPPAATNKPSNLTKQGIAKATAIINSVSNNINTKVAKAGTKRQAKQPIKSSGGGGTAVKITKTVSRVRHNNAAPQEEALASSGANNVTGGAKQKLVVSFPINSIATEQGSGLSVTTTPSSSSSSSLPHPTPLTTSTTYIRAVPALTKAKPTSHTAPPPPSASSLVISTMGTVHVTTLSSHTAPPPPLTTTTTAMVGVPPLIPDVASKGKVQQKNSSRSTSSSSSSSGTSSDSDSAESGSDLSSDSEDESMDTGGGGGGGTRAGGGPVQLVSTVKNSSDLPRPKAILSPVKMTPPMLVRVASATGAGGTSPTTTTSTATTIMSPQPAFATWNQSQAINTSGETVSSSEVVGMGGAFMPVASPLASPPAGTLPFSSLNNPGAGSSAFQVFSPKRVSATSSPHIATVTAPPLIAHGPAIINPSSSSSTSSVSHAGTKRVNSRPNSTGQPNSK